MNKNIEEIVKLAEREIIDSIVATYPERLWPRVHESKRAKNGVMAQALRDMAPAMAGIAIQVFRASLEKIEKESYERGVQEQKNKQPIEIAWQVKDQIERQAIQATRNECLAAVEKEKIDKVLAYPSENADIYRAYDMGRQDMKYQILSDLKSLNKNKPR